MRIKPFVNGCTYKIFDVSFVFNAVNTMIPETTSKNCKCCSKPIKGRTDKKFCDDYCRNVFNNQLKAESNNLVRNINNALRKNRGILNELLPDKERMVKAKLDKLLELGFQFKYHTHTYTNQKGNIYHFCYEYGYLPIENNLFLIVRRNED
jgi:predicted nucleic acid-binding Zn ribbon protein